MDTLAKALVTPQRLPNPALVGKPAAFIAEKVGITVPDGTRGAHRAAGRRRTRLSAFDREAVPRPVLVRRQGLAGGLRALHPDPALRRHGPHHVDPLEERRRDPAVRPEEAGVPHLRQHADHARVDRADDRPRPGDDARLRRAGAATSRPTTSRRGTCSTSSGWPTSFGRPWPRAGVGAASTAAPLQAPARPAIRRGPQAPAKPAPRGISADELRSKVDQFLASRGYKRADESGSASPRRARRPRRAIRLRVAPVAFVCEDDVRAGAAAGTQDR